MNVGAGGRDGHWGASQATWAGQGPTPLRRGAGPGRHLCRRLRGLMPKGSLLPGHGPSSASPGPGRAGQWVATSRLCISWVHSYLLVGDLVAQEG